MQLHTLDLCSSDSVYRVPVQKGLTTRVQSFISNNYQLPRKNHIDILAYGHGVIHAKKLII